MLRYIYTLSSNSHSYKDTPFRSYRTTKCTIQSREIPLASSLRPELGVQFGASGSVLLSSLQILRAWNKWIKNKRVQTVHVFVCVYAKEGCLDLKWQGCDDKRTFFR